MTRCSRAGFPHSDIRGSLPAFDSPRLFADCCVLLRQLVPGHPPCALICLISQAPRPLPVLGSFPFASLLRFYLRFPNSAQRGPGYLREGCRTLHAFPGLWISSRFSLYLCFLSSSFLCAVFKVRLRRSLRFLPDLQNDTVNFSYERFQSILRGSFFTRRFSGILHSLFSFPQSPEGRPRVRSSLSSSVSP